jgi:hypothetical protein
MLIQIWGGFLRAPLAANFIYDAVNSQCELVASLLMSSTEWRLALSGGFLACGCCRFGYRLLSLLLFLLPSFPLLAAVPLFSRGETGAGFHPRAVFQRRRYSSYGGCAGDRKWRIKDGDRRYDLDLPSSIFSWRLLSLPQD